MREERRGCRRRHSRACDAHLLCATSQTPTSSTDPVCDALESRRRTLYPSRRLPDVGGHGARHGASGKPGRLTPRHVHAGFMKPHIRDVGPASAVSASTPARRFVNRDAIGRPPPGHQHADAAGAPGVAGPGRRSRPVGAAACFVGCGRRPGRLPPAAEASPFVSMSPRTESVGLCATCAHSRVIGNRRGSRFWLCGLSESDSSFPRYPPLPVIACRGYRDRERDAGEPGPGSSQPPRQ